MYYRLVSTPAGFGVFGGAGMAFATGFRFWLSDEPLVVVLEAAAIGGVAFGVLFGRASKRRLEVFPGLTSSDRVAQALLD